MKGEEYTCEHCKGSFLKVNDDEEMLDELAEVMPEAVGHETAIICDDCWIAFKKWFETLTMEERLKMKDDYIKGNYN